MNARSEAALRTAGGGDRAPLRAAGLPDAGIEAWLTALPQTTGVFTEDCRNFGVFWRRSDDLAAHLPAKPQRTVAQAQAADMVHRQAREARERFLRRHAEAVYAGATHDFSRFVRVQDLVGWQSTTPIPSPAATPPRKGAEACTAQLDYPADHFGELISRDGRK